MARMSIRTVVFVVLPLSLLTGAVGYGIYKVLAFINSRSDSPVEVVGGSIFSRIGPGQHWSKTSDRLYTTEMPVNPREIYTKGVDTAPASIPNLNGWVITLSSRDTAGNRKPGQVTICSDQGCTGRAFDSYIYLNTKPDSRWKVNKKGELHFHDRACDGDNDDAEDRRCDFLVDVTIESPKGTTQASGVCKRFYGAGHCKIGIGPPYK